MMVLAVCTGEQITSITEAQQKIMMCDMCPFGMLVAVVQVQRTVHIPQSQNPKAMIIDGNGQWGHDNTWNYLAAN